MESLLEEMPECALVIEGMNKEFDEAMERIKELEKERDYYKYNHPNLKRFQVPKIKVDTVDGYAEYDSRIEKFEKTVGNLLDTSNNLIEDLNRGVCNIEGHTIIPQIIDALNELTNHSNPEWSRFRILHAVELSFGAPEDKFKDVVLGNIMMACCGELVEAPTYYSLDGITPSHNLSGWNGGDEEQTLNLYTLCYYTCEKCGNEDDYGICEKTNQLLCCDCQFENR